MMLKDKNKFKMTCLDGTIYRKVERKWHTRSSVMLIWLLLTYTKIKQQMLIETNQKGVQQIILKADINVMNQYDKKQNMPRE